MSTYAVTFTVVVDADDIETAVEAARQLISDDRFEPTTIEDIS